MTKFYWIKFSLHCLAAASATLAPTLAQPAHSANEWIAVAVAAIGSACIAGKAYLSEASTVDRTSP